MRTTPTILLIRTFTFQIHHLTSGQSFGSERTAQSSNHIQDTLRGLLVAMFGDVQKGLRQQGVTGQNGHVLAVYDLF